MTKDISKGRSEACANIALAKYWGKSALGDNLTAVPSLSLTLDALRTRTEVIFDAELKEDEAVFAGIKAEGLSLQRISRALDRFRNIAEDQRRARVLSFNNFPTAAGLASSASGFAALCVAASSALTLPLSVGQLSDQARKNSASAGRSLFGGFAELEAKTAEAQPIAPSSHWDVAMVVAVISSAKKAVGSTGGMLHTEKTCPYYQQWVDSSPAIFEEVKAGVLSRDFERVATYMEHSTRLMHATMMTSLPPVLYFKGATIELMHEIQNRRAQGEEVAYTMDAGPNVKVFTLGAKADGVARWLREYPGVEDVLICRPGPGAAELDANGPLQEAIRTKEWAADA